MTEKSIMIISGEASGDLHGANLVRAVHRVDPTLRFTGIGGARLQAAGVSLFFDIRELSVMGLTEVVAKLPVVLNALNQAREQLKKKQTDLLILIDFPEFNLKLAKTAKKCGIPVLYYISPKIWAWRTGRIRRIKSLVDRMVVILPFEKAFYREHGMNAAYVGHPLMDTGILEFSDSRLEDDGTGDGARKSIGLLPGSREKEITGVLPVMMAAARRLSAEDDALSFIVSRAPSVAPELIEAIVSPFRSTVKFDVVQWEVAEIFRRSEFLMAASGTVTLEAAIFGIPMVVLYKMSPLSFFLAQRFVRLEHACLVNLIAGKEVVPELLQQEARPETIVKTVRHLLKDSAAFSRMKNELYDVRKQLGEPGASDRAARIVIDMVA